MKKKMFYGANKIIFGNAKSLRKNLTEEEMILWERLKVDVADYKFRRQHPISNYIADFYCHRLKLIIEVDGLIHSSEENQKLDEKRQQNLENLGLMVLRFTNEDVHNRIKNVMETINEFEKKATHNSNPKIKMFNSKKGEIQTKFPL